MKKKKKTRKDDKIINPLRANDEITCLRVKSLNLIKDLITILSSYNIKSMREISCLADERYYNLTRPSADARLNKKDCITDVKFLERSISSVICGLSGFSSSNDFKFEIISFVLRVNS